MLFDRATFYNYLASWIVCYKNSPFLHWKKKNQFCIKYHKEERKEANWKLVDCDPNFCYFVQFFSSFIYSWPQAINWVNHEGKIFVVYRIYCCETAAALYIKINYHFSYFLSTMVSKGFFSHLRFQKQKCLPWNWITLILYITMKFKAELALEIGLI